MSFHGSGDERAERSVSSTGRSHRSEGPHERSENILGALTEDAILRRIFPRLPMADAQIVGRGDDAAVMAAPDGRYVVTTDMLVHGADFRLAWSTPNDLGWKAAASNLADVAAMGARPTALVAAIAAPRAMDVAVLEGIADGLRECCIALAPGCGVVGGDLSTSEVLTISITAFGDLEGRSPVLRSGASVDDVVAVAGDVGVAARGLRLLFDEARDEAGMPSARLARPLRQRHSEVIDGQLRPSPPIFAGPLAARTGATAMIDISDGLSLDASRLAKASGVGINFYSGTLGHDVEFLLEGGEDHALLATFPSNVPIPEPFRAIGCATADSGQITLDGRVHAAEGWNPYTGWDGSLG